MKIDLRMASDDDRKWALREALKLSEISDAGDRADAICAMLLATRLAARLMMSDKKG